MLFKDEAETSQLLKELIVRENLPNPIFTYISPDSQGYSLLINPNSRWFFDIKPTDNSTIIIIDNGSTRASEFVEFTDKLRTEHHSIQLIIVIPFIPQAEEKLFKEICDRLLTLHTEPLFFSIDQFYRDKIN